MFSEERQQIIVPDSAMTAGCPVRVQQFLFNPVDHRTGVDVKKTADVVGCIDRFDGWFGSFHLLACSVPECV
jgi:hypothetical protein